MRAALSRVVLALDTVHPRMLAGDRRSLADMVALNTVRARKCIGRRQMHQAIMANTCRVSSKAARAGNQSDAVVPNRARARRRVGRNPRRQAVQQVVPRAAVLPCRWNSGSA